MVLASLITICYGTTSVWPAKGYSAESTLKAIHNEKYFKIKKYLNKSNHCIK
jgi:hypothetical protein